MALPIIRKTYLLKLGDFVFEADTAPFSKLSRSSDFRWKSLEIFGEAPRYQYLGPGEDRFTISGAYYPFHRGGMEPMERLREKAGMGEPHRLIYTNKKVGENMGLWIILSIKETRTHFLPDGSPRKIEFQIEIKRYG
ncbi:phage tail protein [Pseudobacteriovorax antillogorgiicola]|uniref:Phage P2 GpU n=1 Tax=Pseudobacteriovorax antillogorgiicola TaxID=1513793 RepID=A0A1Y6CCZ3_9BACT|nr:phage tail protein [Pseudobacteriovorax antillogorgiicola]TCS51650.1 hypothetical protein EDD56_11034 [Pseudobacteriovorax antillogorgiicola]SMF48814.1 hypothetical protein SAMN06296036_1153 [Pseudobacteriovorax antillogorgiicola]